MKILILFCFFSIILFSCGRKKHECDRDATPKKIKCSALSVDFGEKKTKAISFEINKDSVLTITAENLNITKFKNGDDILFVNDSYEAAKANSKKIPWCAYYLFDKKNEAMGLYYNSYAIMDPRGLAPEGWHVPSVKDWQQLWNIADGEKEEMGDRSFHILYDPKTFEEGVEFATSQDDLCPEFSSHLQRPLREFNITGLGLTAHGRLDCGDIAYESDKGDKKGFINKGETCEYWSSTKDLKDGYKGNIHTFRVMQRDGGVYSVQPEYSAYLVRCVKNNVK